VADPPGVLPTIARVRSKNIFAFSSHMFASGLCGSRGTQQPHSIHELQKKENEALRRQVNQGIEKVAKDANFDATEQELNQAFCRNFGELLKSR